MLPLILALTLAPPPAAPDHQSSDLVRNALAQVSAARAHAAVVQLAAFGTRHSLSDRQNPARGYLASANWLVSELNSIADAARTDRLSAGLETFEVPASARIPEPTTLTNVVARLQGTDPAAAARTIYMVAHLDSRNTDPLDATADAPGANDDASGCAVLLESARILITLPLRASVVFLFTGGEEQGLIGARHHADAAAARRDAIIAVLNNDIVGDPVSTDPGRSFVRVFSEAIPRNPSAERLAQIRADSEECDSPSRQLARFVADIAGFYDLSVRPRLVFRPDRFLRGGDHSAFNEAGFPAVRFTTLEEVYDRQHVNVTKKDGKPYGDVAGFVDADYLAGVTRVNLAAAIHLAMAPAAPANVRIITAQLLTDTTIRCAPSPDAAGYEIVHRDTTSPTWEHIINAGDATELTVKMSKDNSFFGIRAYSKDGWRSPVTFARAARE